MKKLLTLLGFAVAGLALAVSAQVSSVSSPNFFKYVGTSIVPTNASSTIGTSTQRVAGGFFTNLTVTGTCTGCGGSGNATTSIAGVTSNNFTIATTTTGSVFSFATSSNTITFRFPSTPTFQTGIFATSSSIGTTTMSYPFTVETGSTTNTTGINLSGWVNDFLQYNVVNRSTSTSAQSGFSATSNVGTATTSFMWIGINNSLFGNNQAYNIGSKLDTNVLGLGNDMYIANGSTTGKMVFVTGGTSTTTQSRMTITSNGAVVIATTTAPTYGFTVATSTQFLGDVVPRTVAYTASTSITIDTSTTDIATMIVAHATTTFNTPTGTLYNGKMFEMMVTATTSRGLAWSTGFASSTDLALPTTVASGTAKMILEYRSQSAKWELNGLISGFAN